MLEVHYLLQQKSKVIDEQEFKFLIKNYHMQETDLGQRCSDCKRSWIDRDRVISITEK